jgi:cell division protein FtsQ
MKQRARRAPSLPSRPRRQRIVPAMRQAARWTLPVLLVAGGVGAVMLSRFPEGQAILARASDGALALSARLGLVVNNIEVEGRETTDAATIMAALSAERGTPIFAVNPSRAKEQLERLPWVRTAAIERHLPDTLRVRLVERHPLAVWQHSGKQDLIDGEGEVIGVSDLSRFGRLPTVVGNDAARHARALIDMLAREPELAARVTAAVWVDDRRWNLRLDHRIEVLLPEENPAAAWTHLAILERTGSVLQRDIQAVDLRLPDRVVLRVNAAPASEVAPAKKAHPPGKST